MGWKQCLHGGGTEHHPAAPCGPLSTQIRFHFMKLELNSSYVNVHCRIKTVKSDWPSTVFSFCPHQAVKSFAPLPGFVPPLFYLSSSTLSAFPCSLSLLMPSLFKSISSQYRMSQSYYIHFLHHPGFLSLSLSRWQSPTVCLFSVFTELPLAIYPVVPPCQSSGVQANWHSRCSIADRAICSDRYPSQKALIPGGKAEEIELLQRCCLNGSPAGWMCLLVAVTGDCCVQDHRVRHTNEKREEGRHTSANIAASAIW